MGALTSVTPSSKDLLARLPGKSMRCREQATEEQRKRKRGRPTGVTAPELLQLLAPPLRADPGRANRMNLRVVLRVEAQADTVPPSLGARGVEECGGGETLPRVVQGRMTTPAQLMWQRQRALAGTLG